MPDLFGGDDYEGLERTAEISPCGRYRYRLRRSWRCGGDGRTVCFVMLNPSTADADFDDPTVRRVMGYAQRWGFSAVEVRNLCALRATDPDELAASLAPFGERGDAALAEALDADLVVAAWGAHPVWLRDRWFVTLARTLGKPLFCLGTTKAGAPRHPLYIRADKSLEPFVEE